MQRPETDAALTELALCSTVREMRARLVKPSSSETEEAASDEMVSLGITLSAADAWLWQWTRRFAEHAFNERTTEGFVHALLSESYSSLSHVLPANDLEVFDQSEREADASSQWRQQLDAWREESEKRCEDNFSERGPGGKRAVAVFELPASLEALDARIAQLAGELGQREVELGRAARALHEAEGWRRLGYATESSTSASDSGFRRRASRRRSRWRGAGVPGCARRWARERSGTRRRSWFRASRPRRRPTPGSSEHGPAP